MAYVILPSDREFAWFLEWTELGRLDAERWQPDYAAEAADLYQEQTEQMSKAMQIKKGRVAVVANIATTCPEFTFTPEQIAIAIGVRTRQMKEAS